jgi:hypothetical protein
MPSRQTPVIVRYARQLFARANRRRGEAVLRLRGARITTAAEAEGLLEILAALPQRIRRKNDVPVLLILSLLQRAEGEETGDLISHEGPAVLDRVIRSLPPTSLARNLAVKLLATIATPVSLRLWVEHFLANSPKLIDINYYIASVPLLEDSLDHRGALFPRLLDGLACREKRFFVVAIANAVARGHPREPHPLADHVDVLEEMLAPSVQGEQVLQEAEIGASAACMALAYISSPRSQGLLRRALACPSNLDLRLEAAYGLAHHGDELGTGMLIQACRSPRTLRKAQGYLEDLNLGHLVPAESRTPDQQALAEFAEWLADPRVLGRPPDDMAIVDHRDLAWPPSRERKPFWLIQYWLHDPAGGPAQTDCGLVGSLTFCMFGCHVRQRPPEDAYALHCFVEMRGRNLIQESKGSLEEKNAEYQPLWSWWQGEPLTDGKILHVVEMAPALGYPGRLAALASARRAGEEGWVVLDGPRSTWYPGADMPKGSSPGLVLVLHVGRHLLGFTGQPNRQAFLSRLTPTPEEQGMEGYERLLAEAKQATGSQRREALDILGPLGQHFQAHVDALVGAGRQADLESLIEFLAPAWDHGLGMGELGTAAFKGRRDDLAESFFVRLREVSVVSYRGEPMSLLAEIWVRQGKRDAARGLLADCLKKLLAEAQGARGSDRGLIEEWFQYHRATYLRLFPDLGEDGLAGDGIPASTRRDRHLGEGGPWGA